MEENNMETKTEKRGVCANDAPFWRWLLAVLLGAPLGLLAGGILSGAVKNLPVFAKGAFLEPELALLTGMLVFAGLFWGLCFGIRVFCKTPMRAFFFGSGRKAEVKAALLTGLLYLLGLTLAQMLTIGNVTYDHQPLSLVLTNLVFCLLLVWMQTSSEEILFRGLFLRIPYGNNMPDLPKGLFAAVISSLLFMAAHLYNPEVTTQSGFSMILTASTYFMQGFLMFLANLLIGGMEGGLILHFVNNFFCFFFLRAEVTALLTPALFVDHTQGAVGPVQVLAILIAYVPPLVYLLLRRRKKHE